MHVLYVVCKINWLKYCLYLCGSVDGSQYLEKLIYEIYNLPVFLYMGKHSCWDIAKEYYHGNQIALIIKAQQ